MKKYLTILISVFILISSSKFVFADYASDYQTYLNDTGIYQGDYNNYLTARSNYLASGSLDSKDKAMKATLAMLEARDTLVIGYLNAITSKIQSTKGISPGDQSSLKSQISNEVSWYVAHNQKLPSAGSLEDLVSDSDEAKGQWNGITLIVIYKSLIALGIGNNTYIRGEISNEINILQTKIDEIKTNQDKDVSSIERNLIDIENKISRSQDKDNMAQDLANSIKPTDQNSSNFSEAQGDLSDSNSYLKEANDGLLQIISQIKSAN